MAGLADAGAALAAEFIGPWFALRPIGLHAVLRRNLGGGRSGIVDGLAVEPRAGRGEGHDGRILEAAMFAVGDFDRHLERDARTLGEIDMGVRALIIRAAADAAPWRREGDRVRRKAELLVDLDRALIRVGPEIGHRHDVIAAEAAAGGFAVALCHLGGLEIGGIAGDERRAIGEQPLQEGVGLGGIGVVAREEVFVRAYRRGEGEDIRHGAAGPLKRGQRRRDGHRHGERPVNGDSNRSGRIASHRRPSDTQPGPRKARTSLPCLEFRR